MWGIWFLFCCRGWGGGGVDSQCLTYLNCTIASPLPPSHPALPSVWFSSLSYKEKLYIILVAIFQGKVPLSKAL